MFHPRLNTSHWFYALFVLAAVVMGCVGEEPVPVSQNGEEPGVTEETNEAVAQQETKPLTALKPESRPVEAETELPAAEREPIYDVDADGAELIAAALERARQEHKHVLVEWGGNWCGWCYKLHDVFTRDEQVRPIVFKEYELVLIDSGSNRELMERYGGADRQYSYPHLTILDAEGNVLVNQNTEPLEKGPQHDPAKVAEFLGQWTPEPLDAETLLASALTQAAQENKRILIHVGTPYCGWCGVLSRFLREHESQLADDFIDLKIDTMRMTHGAEIAERFQPAESLGIPWMVILDASGEVLTTSVGPDGNCGYPYYPQEIDHFIGMLTATGQHMSDEDLAAIRADLDAFRKEREAE